jgi:signal transduction histidine kinase
VVQTLSAHGHQFSTRATSLALLDRGLHQIQSTVTALLPQARSEHRPLNVIDFDDIILLAKTSAGGIPIKIETTIEIDSALRVPADPVRQVMLNLLTNALKAVDESGVLQATLQADENEVRFLVANSGTSMSEDLLERIITAESGKDPRGFGLWVCREIAIRYDGGFRVINDENDLTQLLFWIPNVERHETTPAD